MNKAAKMENNKIEDWICENGQIKLFLFSAFSALTFSVLYYILDRKFGVRSGCLYVCCFLSVMAS